MNAHYGFMFPEVLIYSSVTAEEKIAEDYLPPFWRQSVK